MAEEKKMTIAEESLAYHYEKKGKIEVISKCEIKDKHDLSLAYTPGVAQPCLEIQKDINKSCLSLISTVVTTSILPFFAA